MLIDHDLDQIRICRILLRLERGRQRRHDAFVMIPEAFNRLIDMCRIEFGLVTLDIDDVVAGHIPQGLVDSRCGWDDWGP